MNNPLSRKLLIDFRLRIPSAAATENVAGASSGVGGGEPHPAPWRMTASGEERRISSAASPAGVGRGVGREGIGGRGGTAVRDEEDLRRFLNEDRRRSMEGLREWEDGAGVGGLEGAEG